MKQNSVESGFINAGAAAWIPPTTTFASAPQSPATGSVYLFTDALTPGANVGGGTSLSTCRWSGSAWVSAGAGPATIIQDEGTPLTQRASLNFAGAGVTATDDSNNGRTVVTIPGGYADPLTTKGDLLARSASATTRLAVGTVANQTLLVDSAQALGIKWATMTAAMVTNAVDQTGSYTNPAWIVSIPWSKVSGAPSVSSYQTPWLSDIDGAGFMLKSTGNVGIGNTGTPVFSAAGYLHLTVGPQSTSAQCGIITACTNTTGVNQAAGSISYANFSLASADKRIAEIRGDTDTSADSGRLVFNTWNAGVQAERMRIAAAGSVGIGTANPQGPMHVRVGANMNFLVGSSDAVGGLVNIRAVNDNNDTHQPFLLQASTIYFNSGIYTCFQINNDLSIQIRLGAAMKTLSVDGSGFVKAT